MAFSLASIFGTNYSLGNSCWSSSVLGVLLFLAFFTGAFTFSIGQTGRIDVLSGGKVSSLDFEAICDRLIITLAAGIRELCARDPKIPIAEDIARRSAGA